MSKVKHKEKPDPKHYTEIAIQLVTILFAVVLFIWQSRGLPKEEKIFFWLLGIGVLVSIFILLAYLYVKPKFDKIGWLEYEMIKLKEQVSFRKALEEINYKLGRLDEKTSKKK